MEEKFNLYQHAKTADGTLYDMELSAPYGDETKEEIAELLEGLAPDDIAYGSIAKYRSEDANGSKFEWVYEYEKNVEDEGVFMLMSETYIDRIPNGEVVPSGTITITENGEGIDVSSYAYADVNVSGGDYPIITVTGDQSNPTFTCDWSRDKIGEAVAQYQFSAGIMISDLFSTGGTWVIDDYENLIFGTLILPYYLVYNEDGTVTRQGEDGGNDGGGGDNDSPQAL